MTYCQHRLPFPAYPVRCGWTHIDPLRACLHAHHQYPCSYLDETTVRFIRGVKCSDRHTPCRMFDAAGSGRRRSALTPEKGASDSLHSRIAVLRCSALFCREPPTKTLQQKSSRHVRMTGSSENSTSSNQLFILPTSSSSGSRLGSRRSPAIGHGHLRAFIPQLPPCSRYSRENPRTAWACFTFKDDLVRIQTCFRSCSEGGLLSVQLRSGGDVRDRGVASHGILEKQGGRRVDKRWMGGMYITLLLGSFTDLFITFQPIHQPASRTNNNHNQQPNTSHNAFHTQPHRLRLCAARIHSYGSTGTQVHPEEGFRQGVC